MCGSKAILICKEFEIKNGLLRIYDKFCDMC